MSQAGLSWEITNISKMGICRVSACKQCCAGIRDVTICYHDLQALGCLVTVLTIRCCSWKSLWVITAGTLEPPGLITPHVLTELPCEHPGQK